MSRWVTTLDGVAFDLDDPSTVPPPWEMLGRARPSRARREFVDPSAPHPAGETLREASLRLGVPPETLVARARRMGLLPPANPARRWTGKASGEVARRLPPEVWDSTAYVPDRRSPRHQRGAR